MAAAAELLGHSRHVTGARAEADLDAAPRLLHEKQPHLNPFQAARVIHQVFGVLRRGPGSGIVAAVNFRVGDAAVTNHLQPLENHSRKLEPRQRALFEQVLEQ